MFNATAKPDFSTMNAIQLIEVRNDMAEAINAKHGTSVKPIRMYQNKERGLVACEKFWSVYDEARNAADVHRMLGLAPIPAAKTPAPAISTTPENREDPAIEGDVAAAMRILGSKPVMSPGQARLANHPDAEGIRARTLAEQSRARMEVTIEAGEKERYPVSTAVQTAGKPAKAAKGAKAPKVEKPAKAAKAPKAEKAAKADGAKRGLADTAVIKVLAKENPSRESSRRGILFAKYRDGMTVADYVKAVGDRGEALHRISSDSRRGHVSVKG